MSSFLKTSFIHDETAPSESLVLHLKRSFSRQHHLHFFLVFSIARPSPRIVCFALGLHQRQTGIAGNQLVGHARPCPCPGALCEGWTGSPTVDLRGQLIYRYTSTRVWAVTEPDALRSIRTSKSISFFVENVLFAIFHPKLALLPPPVSKCVTFRKKLRTYEMLP